VCHALLASRFTRTQVRILTQTLQADYAKRNVYQSMMKIDDMKLLRASAFELLKDAGGDLTKEAREAAVRQLQAAMAQFRASQVLCLLALLVQKYFLS
jgi:hypothetical protein